MDTMINPCSFTLLTLSYFIIAIASGTFSTLVETIQSHSGNKQWRWLLWSAFTIGCCFWAVNFFGLVAYLLPANTLLNSVALNISIITSIAVSIIVFSLSRNNSIALQHLLIGLCFIAAFLLIMFKALTTALHLPVSPPPQTTLIIFIAVNLSIAIPLLITAQLKKKSLITLSTPYSQLLSLVVIGTVFVGIHWVGIASTQPLEHPDHLSETIHASTQLAFVISLFASGLMVSTWLLAKNDQLNTRSSHLLKSLNRSRQDLQFIMMHDPLTRLPNRALLEDRISKILARAKRHQTQFAVISVDLDRFKTINNTAGHTIGDELIQQVAKRLQQSIRGMDTISRVGGDEFLAAIDDGVNEQQLTQIAQRMISATSKVFLIKDHEIRISLSLGLSLYPRDGLTIRELLINADTAMFFSKKMGRNNFHFFDASMKTLTEQKKRMEKRLRLAVEQGLFTLAYQPKIDINNNTVCGVEALLRWQDAELGDVPPDDFIPLSEEIGLILPLGLWVLNTACQQTKQWLDEGICSLPVAVNISPYQLNQTGFSDLVQQALNTSGLPPHYLELEITESAVMQNPNIAREVLNGLNQMGVRISIDDFGTGYSNLAQLKGFPIDRLKIDRSFTSGITDNKQDAAIVKAIIALAHSLNLEVIAEGVETQEQLDFIRQLNGEQYQGYLCSKPLSLSEFRAFIAIHPNTFDTQATARSTLATNP